MDLASEQLWRDSQEIDVTPKAWAVLRYLVERPGQLVTKTELLDAVWGEVSVADGSLTRAIFELRGIFGDTSQNSRFIQTVHRRGFRFIAPLETATEAHDAPPRKESAKPAASDRHPNDGRYIRHANELERLHDWFALALEGQRQTVFVIGEPGIGKTALVDQFLKEAPEIATPCFVGLGQCIEQYGPREAFMPVLEALGRLCRQPGGERLIEILRRHAPTWLAEIPGLLDRDEREKLQRETPAVTAERMLRVMVEALEVMSAEAPVILVLEDLHWSDFSTLDLLSALAQRREAARLMVLATYRPVDAIVQNHPVHEVKHALELHERCRVLVVELLSEAAVHTYLQRRFVPNAFPQSLAHLLHRHTDGNPLFLQTAIQYLRAEGFVAQQADTWQLTAPVESIDPEVPETLRLLIERNYRQLAVDERLLLDAASVAGHTIAAPAIAAAIERDVAAVEAICTRLARHEIFLRQLEGCRWPDGTNAAQYRFVHSLYERTLYDHVSVDQRQQWHERIGERIETGYHSDTAAVAAELAVHFENAGAHERCIRHLEQAAGNASRRFADQEAIGYLERALQRLSFLPDTPERIEHDVSLLLALSALQVTTLGYASEAVRDSYAGLLTLCREKEASPQILPALGGIALYHLNKGELSQAQQFAEQMLAAAERLPLPSEMLSYSRLPLVLVLFYRGRIADSVECLEKGLELCDPALYSHAPHIFSDHGVSTLSYLSILWVLRGRVSEAVRRSAQALERAHAIDRVGSLAHAYSFAAVMRYFLRDWAEVERLGAAAARVAEDNGLRFWRSQALVMHGAGMAQMGRADDGIASMRAGYDEMHAAGGIATGTYVRCMIAEALLKVGRVDEAASELDEAAVLAEQTDERFAEAELYRNRGVIALLRASASPRKGRSSASGRQLAERAADEASGWFEQAIRLAQSQGASWWELRATVALCRLWAEQGRRDEARERLQPACAKFCDDASTLDQRDAAALLTSLGA